MGRLRKFGSLTRSEKLYFCEASILLLLSTLCVKTIVFKHINRFLRARWSDVPQDASDRVDDIRRVERAVSRAAKIWPWKSQCLSRSISTYIMLRRRGVPVALYAGVRVSEDSSLHAHAWVGIGGETTVQRTESFQYTTLLRIGREPVDG